MLIWPLMLRVVIDTNTWISALIWTGHPKQLVTQSLQGHFRAVTSAELMAEFRRVLGYPRIQKAMLKRNLDPQDLATQFGLFNDLVDAPALATPVCRDPDDDAVLACAVAAKAQLIVSGDDDLAVLQSFEGIPILRAAPALQWLESYVAG